MQYDDPACTHGVADLELVTEAELVLGSGDGELFNDGTGGREALMFFGFSMLGTSAGALPSMMMVISLASASA